MEQEKLSKAYFFAHQILNQEDVVGQGYQEPMSVEVPVEVEVWNFCKPDKELAKITSKAITDISNNFFNDCDLKNGLETCRNCKSKNVEPLDSVEVIPGGFIEHFGDVPICDNCKPIVSDELYQFLLKKENNSINNPFNKI